MNLVLKVFTILVLVTLSMFTAFTTLVYQYDKYKYEEFTKQNLLSSVSIQKERVHEYLHGIEKLIDLVSNKTSIGTNLQQYKLKAEQSYIDEINDILMDSMRSINEISALHLVSLEGKVLASTNESSIDTMIFHLPDSFEQMQQYKIAESIIRNTSDEVILRSHGPIYHEDKLIGLLYMEMYSVDLTRISSTHVGIGESIETMIVKGEDDGAVFLTPFRFKSEVSQLKKVDGTDYTSPMIQVLKGQESYYEDVVDYRAKEVFAATAYMEQVDWGVIVKIDKDEVDDYLSHFHSEIFTSFLFVLPIIVLLSFLLARSLTRPILDLIDIALRYSKGDFSTKANENQASEIGLLASSFNKMVHELRSSHKRLAEAQTISHMGSMEYNPQSDELIWSDEINRIFEIEQFRTVTTFDAFLEYVHQDDRAELKEKFKTSLLKKEKFHCIYKVRTPKGNIKVVEATAVHEYDNYDKPIKSIGAILNITEAKKKEKQLEELLRLADDHIIMSTTDIYGKITYASKAFCEISGYSLSELMGNNHRIVRHPDMHEELYKGLWDNLTNDRAWQGEIKNRKKDGGYYWVFASINPIYDLEGKKIGYTAIRDDITSRKQVEEIQRISQLGSFSVDVKTGNMECSNQALRILGLRNDTNPLVKDFFLGLVEEEDRDKMKSAMYTLQKNQKSFDIEIKVKTMNHGQKFLHLIGEVEYDLSFRPIKIFGSMQDVTMQKIVSEELISAKSTAEAAVEIKGQFVANMSHEIRTPMNSVLGFLDIVLGSYDLNDEARHYLKKSQNSAKMLLGIINDILDFSKIDAEKMQLESIPFDLKKMMGEIYDMMEFNATSKDIRLLLSFENDIDYCYLGDPLRLKQVIVNLVSNAIKFTHEGYVEIHIEADPSSQEIVIAINDTGIGMSESQLDVIFQPFTQADASTVRTFGGTGLGTVISQNLIELMGGTIDVDSQLGIGSSFIISLSLEKIECSDIVNAITSDLSTTYRTFNILLAEDIDLNAELAQINLGALGHSIEWVKDGSMVLEELKKKPDYYDLILMDIHMPKVDGLEATRQIRKLEAKTNSEHIPIIALTASVTQSEQSEIFKVGMDGFAVKPLELENLTKEMQRVVPKGRGRVSEQTFKSQKMVQSEILEPLKNFFDVQGGLTVWQSEKKYIESLQYFAKNHAEDVARIKTSISNENFDEAIRICHTLKGLSHGSKKLTQESEKVYKKIIARKKEIDFDVLEDVLQEAVELIESIEYEHKQSVAEISSEELRTNVEELIKQLDNGECDETLLESTMYNLKEMISLSEIEKIKNKVDNFEYEESAELLKKYLHSYKG